MLYYEYEAKARQNAMLQEAENDRRARQALSLRPSLRAQAAQALRALAARLDGNAHRLLIIPPSLPAGECRRSR